MADDQILDCKHHGVANMELSGCIGRGHHHGKHLGFPEAIITPLQFIGIEKPRRFPLFIDFVFGIPGIVGFREFFHADILAFYRQLFKRRFGSAATLEKLTVSP